MTEENYTLLQERVMGALGIASEVGQCDGAHHKAWVIDAMVRALLGNGDDYEAWIAAYCYGDDGFMTYSWDEGTPP